MGLHYHARVCVNGAKNHSTGTRNKYIEKDLLENNNPFRYNGSPIDGNLRFRDHDVKRMTFLFFKRHHNHMRRTLMKVIAYEIENGQAVRRLVWTPKDPYYRNFDLNIKSHRDLYHRLTSIDYFSSERLKDLVAMHESHTISNL